MLAERWFATGGAEDEITSMQVGKIVDCTGIVKDPRATTNPVVGSLLDKGLAKSIPCI